MFGGEKCYNKSLNQRDCLADVWFYDLKEGNWAFQKSIGKGPKARRSHAACIVGKLLCIYGGIIFNGKLLKDFWTYHLH